MERFSMIVAAAALCGGLPACAQHDRSYVVAQPTVAAAPIASPAPTVYSAAPTVYTEPSFSDTRQADQQTSMPQSASASPPVHDNRIGYDNWRTSSGFNADPNNPSGAPGSSTIGTSPTR
jgi:hypothetical protein